MTKTDKAIRRFREGNIKGALAIFSTFRIGFTKEERDTLCLAYESLTGHSKFYESLGINTSEAIRKATSIIEQRYGKKTCISGRMEQ